MNTRLIKLLKNNDVRGGTLLDCYNQMVYDDIAPTITTRTAESSNYFIYEDKETNK